MALRLALVSLAALAAGTAAHGQATSIVPDTAPGVSLGTTVANGGGPVTTIDGGTLAGTNLFHSFSTFNLGTGDIAQWVRSAGDEASITNVVNRVTGGTPSTILGMLDSTAIPNADFYFINPAGLVFGTGAQVNVPAAAPSRDRPDAPASWSIAACSRAVPTNRSVTACPSASNRRRWMRWC